MLFPLISFLVLLSDQAVKYLIHSLMKPNQSVPVIKDIIHITYVQNEGAAFGLFAGMTPFLLISGGLIIAAIIYFHNKMRFNDRLRVPLALLLGGSLGNMFDRLFRSYVIDYIDFRFFPVFNIADIMINLGIFLMIVRLFMKEEKN